VNTEVVIRLLNVGLRGISMGSRFLLIFALAKMFEPTELGLFGLMMATVSLSVLIIGADYYTYSQRELLARPHEQWSFVIQHQIKAQLILYGVLLPAQVLIFVFGLMDWQYALWFFALLLVEHIAQEMNRLLVAMHKQLLASLILFVRLGSWVIIVIPLMYVLPQYRSLDTLYTAWLIGGLLAILLGFIVIKHAVPNWSWVKTDYSWLKKGYKVGGMFLVATICFKGLLTFDRYVVEAISSIEILGVYVFYIGIVMGAYSFLDPAVFSFLYPKMLQSYQRNDKQVYQKLFKELAISTIVLSAVMGIVIWIIMPHIINWIDKPVYSHYLDDLFILIVAGFIYAIGFIPHYALYAMRGDRWIVSAHISALVVFFTSLLFLKLDNGIQSVAMALLLAFSWMGLVKMIGYLQTKQHSILLRA
jgi:O-antigen/teichoic acid export membrane protein